MVCNDVRLLCRVSSSSNRNVLAEHVLKIRIKRGNCQIKSNRCVVKPSIVWDQVLWIRNNCLEKGYMVCETHSPFDPHSHFKVVVVALAVVRAFSFPSLPDSIACMGLCMKRFSASASLASKYLLAQSSHFHCGGSWALFWQKCLLIGPINQQTCRVGSTCVEVINLVKISPSTNTKT